MSRSLSYVVQDKDEGLRLDTLCANKGFYASRSIAARYIDEARVVVNGAKVNKSFAVLPGNLVVYDEEDAPIKIKLTGQAIELDLRFEDEYLLVLSKQAGLVCHPSTDHYDGTLVHALIYHCGTENLCNVQGEDDRLGIVHRLDMDTTGLMLAAKTDEVGYALMEAIQHRNIDRRYLSLVQGNIVHDTGMVDAPITRSPNERTRMTVRDTDKARDSITSFKVLERFAAGRKDEGYSLIECKLFTGRTHQIRVHMNYIKHPCVGDPVYGGGSLASQLGLERQFLHSYLLDFEHPITHDTMHFVDSLPEDLRLALNRIKERSRGRTEAGKQILPLVLGDE